MKKFKVLLLSAAVLIVSGCALLDKIIPAPDPQEVVKEMITNMQNLTTSTFNIESTAKQNDPETGTFVDAEIKVSGKSDLSDQNVPNVDLEINIAINTKDPDKGDMNGTVNFLITVAESNIYFKLEELTLPEELQNQIASFVNLYKGNWYKFPSELLPDDVKDTLAAEGVDTTKKEKIQALLRDTQLFNVIESSTENGQYVYKTLINQENLKTLLQEVARIEDQPITEEDLEMLDTFFEDYAHDIVLYINTDSRYLDKVDVAVASKNTDEKLDISLTATFYNHNQAQEEY